MTIREIKQGDNKAVESIIKQVLLEFELPTVGTAYEDEETHNMYASYGGEKEVYFVLEDNGNVVGGGGIKKLANIDENICELQKMYFLPEARGKGFGKLMFNMCIAAATEFGYDKCYLESASVMETAIKIYEKNGFEQLEGPIGGTGHYSCGVWMLKNL